MRNTTFKLFVSFLALFAIAFVLAGCSKHEHAFGEWKVTKVATCTEAGEETRFCDCGEKQTVSIGALGHSYKNSICERCNDKLSQGEEKSDNNDSENNVPDSQGLKFTSNGDGTCYVRGIGTCTDTDIVIPEVSPEGDKVTSIGEGAFYYCSSPESVVIPDSVESIGREAFYYCRSLVNIEVSPGNSNYESIDGNLYTKGGATLVQYAIGKTATSFTIPDSVTSIGSHAFSWCDSLESVVIPDSVESIGDWAFEYCRSLKGVVIPDSVESIGSVAFYYCTSLESVVIPDSVTSIGDYAFRHCTSLESVVIGDSVTSIGEKAFDYCYSLRDVYYTGMEEEWGQISIASNGNSKLTIATIHYNYVPEE